jgi:glucose/mannose transport system substrate-binding protein
VKHTLLPVFALSAIVLAGCGKKEEAPAPAPAPVAAAPAPAPKAVEVLHWWTSGGEAAALGVLKQDLEKQGVSWNDMPVAGGGGEAAMTALRARVVASNPPTAVQMLGFDILDWAKQGALGDLNELAAKEGWDNTVPGALQAFSKHDGKWIAAPVNVHSTNWVWANKAVLEKAGVTKPPANWDDFIKALDKVQKSGAVGLAHGGQPWQEATIFDGVVLATGGVDFYKKALVDKDPAALGSDTMKKAFDRMAQLKKYVDKDFSNRDWNLASAMVIEGKAGFQIMGDWAKGEFLNAKKVPGQDFLCFRVPGTQGMVSFNSDQFAMFKVGDDAKEAQTLLASAIMNPTFQSAFNVVKGSVPARTDVPDTDFDDCGKKGMKDLAEANTAGTLVGSMAHGHSVPASTKNAFYDVITQHFNGKMKTADAVKAMVKAAAE